MATAAGPVAPLVFFVVYAVGASLPIPRPVFSVAAGLLLGNALGLVVALAATMTAAALGYGLARSLGGDLMTRNLHRESVRTVSPPPNVEWNSQDSALAAAQAE